MSLLRFVLVFGHDGFASQVVLLCCAFQVIASALILILILICDTKSTLVEG